MAGEEVGTYGRAVRSPLSTPLKCGLGPDPRTQVYPAPEWKGPELGDCIVE